MHLWKWPHTPGLGTDWQISTRLVVLFSHGMVVGCMETKLLYNVYPLHARPWYNMQLYGKAFQLERMVWADQISTQVVCGSNTIIIKTLHTQSFSAFTNISPRFFISIEKQNNVRLKDKTKSVTSLLSFYKIQSHARNPWFQFRNNSSHLLCQVW